MPSEDEIRLKCLEFQAGWSEDERARRRVGWSPTPPPVEVRVIPESLLYYHSGSEPTVEELIDRDTSGGA